MVKLFKDPGDKYGSLSWDWRQLKGQDIGNSKCNNHTQWIHHFWVKIYFFLFVYLFVTPYKSQTHWVYALKRQWRKKYNGEKRKHWDIRKLRGKEKHLANTGISKKFKVQRFFMFTHRWTKGMSVPMYKRNCYKTHQFSAAPWRAVALFYRSLKMNQALSWLKKPGLL